MPISSANIFSCFFGNVSCLVCCCYYIVFRGVRVNKEVKNADSWFILVADSWFILVADSRFILELFLRNQNLLRSFYALFMKQLSCISRIIVFIQIKTFSDCFSFRDLKDPLDHQDLRDLLG